MSYRLKFKEPLGKGWRRVVREQIELAVKGLKSGTDVDVAIHETRKSMKRVRALLKLLQPGLSAADYNRENQRYRDVARLLSGVRDHAVLSATAETLSKEATGSARQAADAFLALVTAESESRAFGSNVTVVHEAERKKAARVREAIAALEAAAKSLDKLRVKQSSFEIVRRGVERSYRNARRDMKRSFATGIDEDFHVWRKSVQAHWRHMLLIDRAWPDMFAARAQLAKDMSDLLGLDHDLYVLIERANSLSDDDMEGAGRDALVEAAHERQREIRNELQIKAVILFAEPTSRFAANVGVYWRAAKAARKLAIKKKHIANDIAPCSGSPVSTLRDQVQSTSTGGKGARVGVAKAVPRRRSTVRN